MTRVGAGRGRRSVGGGGAASASACGGAVGVGGPEEAAGAAAEVEGEPMACVFAERDAPGEDDTRKASPSSVVSTMRRREIEWHGIVCGISAGCSTSRGGGAPWWVPARDGMLRSMVRAASVLW